MIVAAAVCPAAPWLLAGVAPRLAKQASDIGAAAVAAVATLVDTERIVVVLPPSPGRPGNSQPSTDHLRPSGAGRVAVTRSDRGDGPVLAAAPAVASQLLDRAGIDRPTVVVTARSDATPPPDGVADPDTRIGLLVLADGAAAHGPSAPGREDPRSAEWDDRLTRALAAGRPDALSVATAPTAVPAPEDLLARVDGLRLLAAWTARRPPVQSSLLVHAAPFGVGYFVATWRWAGPSDHPAARP